VVRYRVGVLGATGLVGQRLVERLHRHPWFGVSALAASERSAGSRYGECVRWRLGGEPPAWAADLRVRPCRPDALEDCDLVLSALDGRTGAEVEPAFRDAGISVVSNSAALRMHPDVPLLVPEINAGHLDLLAARRTPGAGAVVTNPNCSVAGLVMALAPLHRAFGVRRVVVTTLQAVSGAGLGGPGALELVDNVLPFIEGEEEKIEREVQKILGVVEEGVIRPAPIDVSAHCHRVAVQDGHLEAVSIELERRAGPAEAAATLRRFRSDLAGLALPSAAGEPLVVREEPDRPQPRLDRDTGGGMSVVVGRVRDCPVLGLKLELLSHNAVRGAAGAALLNAELLAARGLLVRRSVA
jgi:aspartate-semialdehyde dehydrogenase